MIRRILASQNGSSRRAANLTGGVASRELHPHVGNAVNVRTLIEGGALITQVFGTEIVSQDEDNVGFRGC